MNTSFIKLIAITTMVVDHIGAYFYPEVEWLRIVGRLSFPFFAWLIANGAYYTKNDFKYLLRLLLLACISQIPYALVANEPGNFFQSLNVVFTLSLGLLSIIAIKRASLPIKVIASVMCAVLAQVLTAEFGALGVLSIITFYLFLKSRWKLVVAQIVLVVSYFISSVTWLPRDGTQLSLDYAPLIGLGSLVFIALYNNKPGWKLQYLFYAFYPVQYAIIYLLRQ